jgi:hypothetical protein
MAFRTALLLAGTTKTAEAAVLGGIGACESLSHRGLLIEAVRFTIRRRTKSADAPDPLKLLPLNSAAFLCCSRCCGTALFFEFSWASPEVCAELLDDSITEFEDAVCAALNQLPLLSSL